MKTFTLAAIVFEAMYSILIQAAMKSSKNDFSSQRVACWMWHYLGGSLRSSTQNRKLFISRQKLVRFNVILLWWKTNAGAHFSGEQWNHTCTQIRYTCSHTVDITSWNDDLTVHRQKPKAERDIWLDSPRWGNFPTWLNNKVPLCSILCRVI